MDWSIADLGALGEVIGAVAVLLTLIYIARQLRQANLAAQTAAIQAFFSATESINRDARILPQGVLARGLSDWTSLTPNEQTVFSHYLLEVASKIHMGFRLHQRRVLDDATYESWESAFLAIVREPGGAACWETCKLFWPDDFVKRTEKMLNEPGPRWTEVLPWYAEAAVQEKTTPAQQ